MPPLADYTITVTDSAATRNQSVVFSESNINPGDTSRLYPIIIDNGSNTALNVTLTSIEPDPSDPNRLLPAIDLRVADPDESPLFLGKYQDYESSEKTTLCVPPKTKEETFHTGYSFDESSGNDYQATTFKIVYTFSIVATDHCEGGEEPGGPESPESPGTGRPTSEEGSSLRNLFLIILLTASLLGIFFLIQKHKIQKARKKRRKNKNARKT